MTKCFKMKINKEKKELQVVFVIAYLVVSFIATRTLHGIAFILFFALTCPKVINNKLFTLFKSSYIKVFSIFSIYVIISYLWANKTYLDTNVAIVIILGLVEEIYLFLYFTSMIRKGWKVDMLLKIYVCFAIIIGIYILIFTPRSIWIDSIARVGSNLNLNRNMIGMIMAYASAMCLYFSKSRGKKVLNYSLITVMGAICLLTGSRKGALILIGGIIGYLVFSDNNNKLIRNVGMAITILLILYIAIMTNDTLYSKIGVRMKYVVNSIINDGSEIESSLKTRSFYRSTAMLLWKSKPIIGYGIDGFSSYMSQISYWHIAYSHCNYTEMLANYGIIGFLLYYIQRIIMIIRLGSKTIRNNKEMCLLWICCLIMIIMEYACVTYYNLPLQYIYIISAVALFSKYTSKKA